MDTTAKEHVKDFDLVANVMRKLIEEITRLREFEALARETGIFKK